MSDKIITLSDRIKELSRSTGTGNLRLDGAVDGFASFGSAYNYDDLIFYAVTDGSDYEVGSGQYILDGGNNALRRFPVVSSNSNSAVNFGAGIKEVYVTYPGKFAVFTASGLNGFIQPDVSGVAFWVGSQTLNYSPDIVWDNDNSRLGIKQPSPQFAIDVGGLESYSTMNISGVIVGDSGVMFSGVDPSYSGGRQLEPFLRNQLDFTTGTEDVFSLSGLVDQRLLFKQQSAGLVFAGPASGCTPPESCSPDYPTFRALTLEDLPYLGDQYVTNTGVGGASGRVAFYHSSGIIDSDAYFYWDNTSNFLGVNQNNPAANLDVSGNARITSNLVVGGDVTVTGDINATQIVFTDLSVISGAYQAGSGLELHNGIEFNIGNLFNVADNTANSGWIHQGDVLSISGVSGIFTDYNPDSNTLYVGSSGGYGVMKSWNISDGIGGSGDIYQNQQVTISGVSGVTTQYDDSNKLMRIGVSDSGHTIKLDNVITVPLSGVSLNGEQVQNGVSLTAGDRVLLVNQTDARENGIWEVAADPYGSWTRPADFPSSGEASARWTHVQFGTHYDESVWFCVNNYPTRIDYDDQEWRYFDGGAGASGWADATMSSRDAAISGWADARDLAISGWADAKFTNIGNNTYFAGTGLQLVGFTFNTAGTGVFDQIYFTNTIGINTIRIGASAGDSANVCTHTSMIGYQAGLQATGCDNTNMIGRNAGSSATGCDSTNMIGYYAGYGASGCGSTSMIGSWAGYGATDCGITTMIGWTAGSGAYDCDYTNMIGNQAGYQATGCDSTNMIGYQAGLKASGCDKMNMIGWLAGYQATGCDSTNMIGDQAGFQVTGCNYTNMIGYQVGSSATGCDNTNMIGNQAGYQANDCDYTNMIGDRAGLRATGCISTSMIGSSAGYQANDCDYTNMIGDRAGYQASGCYSPNIIGYEAGYEATGCYSPNMIGNQAGYQANDCDYTSMIGNRAGYQATGCNYTNMIGNQAGRQATGCDSTNMIGFNAGYQATGCDDTNMIGYQAGLKASGCDKMNMIGVNAGYQASGCDFTNMIGFNAGYQATGCNYTNMIGYKAGYGALNNTNLIAIGESAAGNISGPTYDHTRTIAIGFRAGESSSNGIDTVCIGTNAGVSSHHNYHSSMIGDAAGSNSHDSSGCIMIGDAAGQNASGCSHSIYMGMFTGYAASGNNQLVVEAGYRPLATGMWSYINRENDNILSINETITGDTSDKYIRIGATGTLATYTGSTLSIKSTSNSRTTLKLEANNTQTAPQLQATSGNANNPIITSGGLLRIPNFATIAAATGAIPFAGNEGVMLFAGGHILISDGSEWRKINSASA